MYVLQFACRCISQRFQVPQSNGYEVILIMTYVTKEHVDSHQLARSLQHFKHLSGSERLLTCRCNPIVGSTAPPSSRPWHLALGSAQDFA